MNPFKDCIGLTGTGVAENVSADADLLGMTYERAIPYVPTFNSGKVVRVYDGDTITVATRVLLDTHKSSRIYRFQVRYIREE